MKNTIFEKTKQESKFQEIIRKLIIFFEKQRQIKGTTEFVSLFKKMILIERINTQKQNLFEDLIHGRMELGYEASRDLSEIYKKLNIHMDNIRRENILRLHDKIFINNRLPAEIDYSEMYSLYKNLIATLNGENTAANPAVFIETDEKIKAIKLFIEAIHNDKNKNHFHTIEDLEINPKGNYLRTTFDFLSKKTTSIKISRYKISEYSLIETVHLSKVVDSNGIITDSFDLFIKFLNETKLLDQFFLLSTVEVISLI